MKEFKTPVLSIEEFGTEDIIRTSSGCFEIFACRNCYCTSVTCDPVYVCEGLDCPILDSI